MFTHVIGLRWAALPIFLLTAATGLLHWHLAVAVAVGFLFGALFAISRRAVVFASVLLCPIVLLLFLVSTVTWKWPLFGIFPPLFGDVALAFPIGFLLGGGAACSLIPYAAARWTGYGLLAALAAWGAGIAVTLCAASFARPLLEKSASAPLMKPEHVAIQRAQHYSLWLTYSGLISDIAYARYEGRIDVQSCDGLYSYAYTFTIPNDARKKVESYTSKPLPDDLRKWFGADSDSFKRPSCSVQIKENAGGEVEVASLCAPTEGMRRFRQKYPDRQFDADLPTIHLQAPFLVPMEGSLLTITAPRGCVASTFPTVAGISRNDTTETMTLRVGFPRDGILPMEFQRLVEEPWVVHVDLMPRALQGSVLARLLQDLDNSLGLLAVTFLAAVSFGTLLRLLFVWLSQLGWVKLLKDAASRPLINASDRIRSWYRSKGRIFKWSLKIAFWFVFALLVLASVPDTVLMGIVLFLLDPGLGLAGILFISGLIAIEVIAFIVRRSPARHVG